jgi:hypothetical protein
LIRGRGNWLCKRGFASLRLSFSISPFEKRSLIEGSLKGRSPFKTYTSPSLLKERGIKGVR